ncbi:PAC2 family protein [Propionibacterium cyclohexanicum]|uniref:PAC2 family protein n=1 Tax=Propionibacterium cyclohexanicum TaxID=64702 RepID=A0A1H9Q2D2_9ACTN|nr:PAC2 family protein [Propionibacterium cyclohexanicum]SER54119.1 PAC2 family protein [Propionibacterium cyclohexanicum]
MVEGLAGLRRPVVIAAFEGWNDAGDAATEVINHLAQTHPTELVWELDSEDYYDFQTTRPRVELTEEGRTLRWPSTRVSVCHLNHRDAVLVAGPEPNLRWRSYCAALISAFRTIDPSQVILLGAMLTDTPHTRPLPVSAASTDEHMTSGLGMERSSYEGPTGIVGVLAESCRAAHLQCVTLWASVPHYVASPPNPKATLALLTRVEDVIDEVLDPGELPDLTKAWQRGVDELAQDDPDIAEYIQGLEQEQDSEGLPDTTGDSLAAEFQRYLRRRDEQ